MKNFLVLLTIVLATLSVSASPRYKDTGPPVVQSTIEKNNVCAIFVPMIDYNLSYQADVVLSEDVGYRSVNNMRSFFEKQEFYAPLNNNQECNYRYLSRCCDDNTTTYLPSVKSTDNKAGTAESNARYVKRE